jgi:hypothetical protein
MIEELEEWIRERTTPWQSPPVQHCLSDKYQPWQPGALFPGLPAFVKDLPDKEKPRAWPSSRSKKEGEKHEEQSIEAYQSLDVKRIQLVRETRNDFARPLTSDKSPPERREAYETLLAQEKSMRQRATDLADNIDAQFKVVDPDSGEPSNLLDQCLKIYLATKGELEANGPHAQLGEVLKTDTEVIPWRNEVDLQRPAKTAMRRPQHDAHDLLESLSTIEERPCIRVKDQGFACGLNWLPADASLEQILKFLELHFVGIEESADRLGNTHALLSYRLLSLELVIWEYELYGQVEMWSFQEATDVTWWYDREIDESRYQIRNVHGLLQAIDEVLSSREHRDHVWHLQKEDVPINRKGLHDVLNKKETSPLLKDDGDPISRQAFRNLINKFYGPRHFQILRMDAGIDR